MGNIKINEIVQEKLRDFKEESGSKTFSDAVNLLLAEHSKLLHRDFVKLANDYSDLTLVVSKLKKQYKDFVEELEHIHDTMLDDDRLKPYISNKIKKWKGKK